MGETVNIREFYQKIGSDYKDVEKRLGSEQLIVRIVSKFVADPTYAALQEAFAKEDLQGAFRAAHTLKGVSSNLGFDRLWQTSSDLTEYLRPGTNPLSGANDLLGAVSAAYEAVAAALKELEL